MATATVTGAHVQQLLRVCVRQQPAARTAAAALFLAFALLEVVLGFQDNCNCLVLSGFLHMCAVIDRAAQWLPQHYHAVRGAPEGFNRMHLLVRLANLCLMMFLCFDCMVEAVVDFRKVTSMRSTTVPLILLASLVLQGIAGATSGTGSRGASSTAAGGTPGDALFGPGASAAVDAAASSGNGSSSSSSSSVPAKVGSVGFLVFAVIQYVLPHDHDHPVRWADSAVTLVAAVAVVARAAPALRGHTLFFMQATPAHKRGAAQACLQQVESLSGVIEYHSERFWVSVPGHHVASLCVRIQPREDEAAVEEQARRIFAPHFQQVTLQIEKDPESMGHWIPTLHHDPSPSPAAAAAAAAPSPELT